MSNIRELSQLASVITVGNDNRNVGIGTADPTSKLHVVGDVNVTGNITGNASSATALQTSRNFEVSGDATAGPVAFNGTANVGLALTLANTTVTPGSYGSASQIPTFTVDSKGRLTAAGTVNVATALTVTGDSGSEVINLINESLSISGGTNLTSSATSNTVTINLDPDISLISVNASGIITASEIVTTMFRISFPTGDYGDFSLGNFDAFGQSISDSVEFDLLTDPSNTLNVVDLGILA